jgi:argininosuccinate lyase
MKMWDGRFTKPADRLMERFNNSLPIDKELVEEDVAGSIAWANALHRAKVLSASENERIVAGLTAVLEECRTGRAAFLPTDEDIHMAVERLLTERIGQSGSKLHTGRSRNDQVATDFRLHIMKRLGAIAGLVEELQRVLLKRAENERDVVVPGYTHLQQAQPISLAHYWLSMLFALEREKGRLRHAIETADLMPLGSGAIAGCGFALDRRAIARELGFSRISDNSMDGVGSRDFVLEALGAISSLGILVSRYAEDLIIWSSREFGFVELDDAWSTGSSMMPQKKNPDSLELIRGKCGRFIGNYTRIATTLKGLGLTYYKDLQEDKEPFFDSAAQIELVLHVFANVVHTLAVREQRIAEQLDPFLLATDLADYLVRKGVPFRAAHRVVGQIVGHCAREAVALTDLTVEQLAAFAPEFAPDVTGLFRWHQALKGRDIAGGTGPKSVAGQLRAARTLLGD